MPCCVEPITIPHEFGQDQAAGGKKNCRDDFATNWIVPYLLNLFHYERAPTRLILIRFYHTSRFGASAFFLRSWLYS
jgi:hypothetical protein